MALIRGSRVSLLSMFRDERKIFHLWRKSLNTLPQDRRDKLRFCFDFVVFFRKILLPFQVINMPSKFFPFRVQLRRREKNRDIDAEEGFHDFFRNILCNTFLTRILPFKITAAQIYSLTLMMWTNFVSRYFVALHRKRSFPLMIS